MTWKNILLALILAAVSIAGGAYYRFVNFTDLTPPDIADRDGNENEGDGQGVEDQQEVKLDIKGRINILLLGEDNVDGVKRSDTVAFVAVDIDERNIRVLSLPRDTRVYIPGHGNQKLNHAYAYGGADLLRATVERFLGTTIHYYVKIDYDNFPKLVDIVGGVDIFVGKAMKYKDVRGKLDINIPAGKQRMDGETALKYVRFRKDALGDIGRVQRQQQFLKALLHKMYEPENIYRFTTIAQEISNTLVTDMRPSTTLQFCYYVKQLEKDTNRIFFMMLPGTPALIDNLSYWVSDPAGVKKFLTADTEELIELDRQARLENRNKLNAITSAEDFSPDSPDGVKPVIPENSPSPEDVISIVQAMPQAVAVLNGTGRGGLGRQAASHLQKIGIDVAHVGNAKHNDYRSSKIMYPVNASEAARESARLLGRLCGIRDALITPDKQATYPSLIVGHDYAGLMKRLENSYATIQ